MSLVPPKLSRANRNSSPAATKSSSKPSSHHSTQPGVIKLPLGPRTLPQHGSPTALSHSSSSESPSRRSRPRRTRLAAAAATNKPLVASLVDSDDTHSDSPPTHPSTPPTPSPAKNRRRGRANRQKSPPNAGEDVVDDRPTSPASSPFVAAPATPPPISDARPSLLSQSAPIALPDTLSGLSSADHSPRSTPRPNYHHDSSADEWDMPASAGGKLEGHTLTWQQQQALRPHSSNHSTSITTPRRTRTESASLGRVGGGLFRGQNQQPRATRPPLSGSVSDSAAATTTTTGLTWQQELLQSSAPSAAASPFSSATAGAVPSPSKLRRQLLRDEMTFGGGSLSLNSPSSSSDSASVQFPIDDLPSPVRQPRTLPNGYSTPTKGPAVERYAGSNFMNSPSPSSLPAPSFLLRRAPVVVAKE